MIPIDTEWIFIFCFWFSIQLMTIFSSQFRLCIHNRFCFPLITSFHFILHNFASTWFLTVVFQFLPVDRKTFIMLSFILFPQDFIYLILGSFIFSFFGLSNLLFLLFLGLPNPLFAFIEMDASCKILHVWSVHSDLSYPIRQQDNSVTCYNSFIHIIRYIRSQCSPNFSLDSASVKFFPAACKAFKLILTICLVVVTSNAGNWFVKTEGVFILSQKQAHLDNAPDDNEEHF